MSPFTCLVLEKSIVRVKMKEFVREKKHSTCRTDVCHRDCSQGPLLEHSRGKIRLGEGRDKMQFTQTLNSYTEGQIRSSTLRFNYGK